MFSSVLYPDIVIRDFCFSKTNCYHVIATIKALMMKFTVTWITMDLKKKVSPPPFPLRISSFLSILQNFCCNFTITDQTENLSTSALLKAGISMFYSTPQLGALKWMIPFIISFANLYPFISVGGTLSLVPRSLPLPNNEPWLPVTAYCCEFYGARAAKYRKYKV